MVVLIDEYDKPMLDHLDDLEQVEAFRKFLRTFYTILKDYDDYLRFIFLTGISKFSKSGVFSAMNNMIDISMLEQYGNMLEYTQEELETCFAPWIDNQSVHEKTERTELLQQIKDYYDGFCFDGVHRVYNPFSTLNFFYAGKFFNFWYQSGSPSFIVQYMRQHQIQTPEEYRHIEKDWDFANAQEIEKASPESFLFQSGYLTIERLAGNRLVLDYPNREVLNSLSNMYLEHVYRIKDAFSLGERIVETLRAGDIVGAVRAYNTALVGIPYKDFGAAVHESLYRALFLMLLRGAGVYASGENATHLGQSDVVAQFPERVVVLEFKLAPNAAQVERFKAAGSFSEALTRMAMSSRSFRQLGNDLIIRRDQLASGRWMLWSWQRYPFQRKPCKQEATIPWGNQGHIMSCPRETVAGMLKPIEKVAAMHITSKKTS